MVRRRRAERLPLRRRVSVKLADRQALQEMYVQDISHGGLFVATQRGFCLGL